MMPFSIWKTITLSLICILVNQPSVISRKPDASYFVGQFGGTASELRQNCLGAEQIQKEINERVSVAELFNGDKLVRKLSTLVRKRLTGRIAALRELLNGVEKNDAVISDEQVQCCKLNSTNVKYNSRFKTKIDPVQFCQLRSKRSHEGAGGLGDSVIETMQQNVEKNHLLKWQYFGSAEGITTIFPSTPTKDCGSYDNRVRPWYAHTANPVSKNIVIVLDTSTSMALPVTMGTKTMTVLDVAKTAVNSVLSTLLQNDQVGVVLFNTKVLLPGSDRNDSCYSERLASASTFNINRLKAFVNQAQPGGGTLYNRGFEAAFTLLKNSPNTGNPNRQSVILFITDGPPNDVKYSIIKLVKDIKTSMKISIITYGIGNNLKMRHVLKALFKETGAIDNHIQDVTHLTAKLTSYYKHLHHVQDQTAYTLSQPYLDAWGLGVIITVAMPLYRNGELHGVAGTDITLPDLLSEIQYYSQAGPDSYAFLAHQDGHVLSHPLLNPPETIINDPSFVHILSLEQGEGFEELFQQMKDAEKDSFHDVWIPDQRRSIPRGSTTEEGVHEIIINSNYYCSKALEYVVCVVLAGNNVDINIQDTDADELVYHRMDLVPQGDICFYADSLSYRDRSVVQFSAKAFRQPLEYLDVKELPVKVTSYLDYINHDKGHGMFLPGIDTAARMGSFLDKLWIQSNGSRVSEYLTQIPRRFFGTYNGVLRVFPGEPLPSSYDHTNRAWYLKAEASADQLTFTTPYRDPLGAGIIVTVSHAITMVTKKANEKTVFGVVAADLTVSYLDILTKNELGFRCKDTKTTTCFLIDTTGYVVYHPSFVQRNVYDNVTMVTSKHITEMHGHIASRLISDGVMTKRKCQNFSDRKLQISYKIKVRDRGIIRDSPTKPRRCDTFALARIFKTNVFVVAAFSNRYSKCNESEPCPCGKTCYGATDDSFCECPCNQRLEFNYCSDTLKEKTIPSCTSSSAQVNSRPPLPPNAADLPKCFEPRCEDRDSEGSCGKTFGCSWCRWDKDKDIATPFCTYDNKCYGGVQGRGNPFLRLLPTNTTPVGQDGINKLKAIVIGGSIAAAILLLSIIAIAVGYYCYRKKKTQEQQPEMHDGYIMPDGYYQPEMQDGTYPQEYNDGYTTQGPQGYDLEQDLEDYEYPEQEGEQALSESEMFDDF